MLASRKELVMRAIKLQDEGKTLEDEILEVQHDWLFAFSD